MFELEFTRPELLTTKKLAPFSCLLSIHIVSIFFYSLQLLNHEPKETIQANGSIESTQRKNFYSIITKNKNKTLDFGN
jgi:hypothetical protein